MQGMAVKSMVLRIRMRNEGVNKPVEKMYSRM
jgi:hypothetical protein